MKKSFLSLIVLLFVSMSTLFAQELQPLPMDKDVRFGVLPNGLTYYIRHNEQPKQRAEFHIAQAVGAILEHDDQDGLAHFLEHMAFNGTEHFPGKGIINYFESIGVNFGGNINAYTSLDETVYRLSEVPTIRESIIDSALLVMRDWSCGLLLEGDEIDSERGVIREEWRTGATANRRMWKAGNELKYPGSQYAIRDVIGDTAVINNFTYDALRRYYKQWYGPDLQAIIVVGDVDVDQIEQKIIKLFSPNPARANRGERPIYRVGDNKEPIVAVVTDNEAQQTRLGLEFKHEPLSDEQKLSIVGYSQGIINSLIETMFSYRFDEISQQPDASFIAAYAGYGELFKADDAFQAIVIPKDGQEKQAYAALLTQIVKADRYGFTNSELERAKAEMLNSYEKSYNERNNRDNISFAREYIRHYLDKEVIPGIEFEFNAIKQLLPAVSPEMINEVLKSYITEDNVIIYFMAPTKAEANLPTKEEAVKMFNASKDEEIEAPKEEVIDRPLVEKAPKAGKIKKTATNASLGTTEWTLSNGMRVVFKPTKFKTDEILLSAYSWGGLSKVETADLPSAMLAASIIEQNGIGSFSNIELKKLLAGKTVSVGASIGNYSEGFSGNSSVKDLETMLQLVYLGFTAPRQDDKAFAALIDMYRTALVNRETNPKTAFSDSVSTTWTSHSPRTQIMNAAWLDRVSQERALAIYKERFAAPSDFLFTFTGNIDPNDPATQKAILTWLGGLKSKKVTEQYVDRGIRSPEGVVKNYFSRDMQIHTASNRINYSAYMPYSIANNLNMRAIGDILSIRYLESIREREGGSYGVGVAGYMTNRPVDQAVLLMQFDTDPEKQEKLLAIIHQEIDEIVKNGPRADDLNKVKESMLKDLSEDMEKNDYWNDTLLYRYYMDNLDYIQTYKKSVEALSAESITDMLKKLVASGNVMEVVMSPTK